MIFVNQLFTPCFCKPKFLIKRIKKNGCLCVQSLFQIIVKILLGDSSKIPDHPLQKLGNYVQNFTEQRKTI